MKKLKPKHRRLLAIAGSLCLLAVILYVLQKNFRENLVFFLSPAELIAADLAPDRVIRIGGLVKEGSITYSPADLTLSFVLTDGAAEIAVHYQGLIPDLFREGQGVVANGVWQKKESVFKAQQILAKHDENYMPPEVARALKKSGHWEYGKQE